MKDKAQKISKKLAKAEIKVMKTERKAGKIMAKVEKKAAKAGVKLDVGMVPTVKKTLRADQKWPVSPKKK